MTMPGTVASIALGAMAVPLSAATFCLLTVAWGRVSLSSGYEPLRQGLPVDTALSFFLGYTIPALLGDVAGEAFRLHCLPVLRALWPLLSSLCLLACLGDGDVDATGAPLHLGKRSGLMPIVALFILLASVLIGAFGGITPGDEDGLLRRHVITGIFSLALIALMYVASRRPRLRLMTWGVTLLLVFAGVFLVIASNGRLSASGLDVLVMARLLIWIMLWMLLVETARRQRLDITSVLAVFYVAIRGVSCLVTDTLDFFGLPAILAPSGNPNGVALAVTLALIGCSFVIVGYATGTRYGREFGMPQPAVRAVTAGEGRHEACVQLGEEEGLTERELAVLECLSQGHTLKHIADEQFVSLNTINTHVRGIYRKLGCHSKQEVIDLVARRMGQEPQR